MLSRLASRPSNVFSRLLHTRSFGSLSVAEQNGDERSRRWAHPLLAALAGVGAIAMHRRQQDNVAYGCGIVGFVGDEEALPMLTEGLTILQNRGYDSAGLSTLGDGKLHLTKKASTGGKGGSTCDSLKMLQDQAADVHSGHTCGIAHTRWATHGGKTDENAHPHFDHKNRIAVVHNGTIENFVTLKKELVAMGVEFRSQTDTEVIVQLISYYIDQGEEYMTAIDKTLARLQGTYGLAIMNKDRPNEIVAARNGSPLVVGIDSHTQRHWIASEHTAFGRYTNEYIALKDGEVAVITPNSVSLDKTRIKKAPKQTIELSPDPYPHWTIKEIMEQPEAVSRALGYGARLGLDEQVKLGGLNSGKDSLKEIRNLIISGCGTSFFAGSYGARLMRYLRVFNTVTAVDAAEINADTFPRQATGVLAVSQSGETKDVHRSLELAQLLGFPCFSIVNAVGSLISRTTGIGCYIYAGRENAVASTKAFITQVTVMALVASWFSQLRGVEGDMVRRRQKLFEALHRLPVYTGMTIRGNREQCKEISRWLKDSDHIFVLGKGFAEPIAKEGALKIKEITYIHAEGYSGGALKHGPFALLEEGTPVILVLLDDEHAHLMKTAAHEVEARGARTIIITDKTELAEGLKGDIIKIPTNGPLTALLAVIPLQLIAYEVAIAKGIDPDRPRNLAKAVTVD